MYMEPFSRKESYMLNGMKFKNNLIIVKTKGDKVVDKGLGVVTLSNQLVKKRVKLVLLMNYDLYMINQLYLLDDIIYCGDRKNLDNFVLEMLWF